MEDVQKIDRSEIQLLRELASGSCGTVWLGLYKGKEVVIKFILDWTDHCYGKRAEFEAEVVVMAGLTHPHIVPLIGICTDGTGLDENWELTEGPALVMPYMRKGDLKKVLREEKEIINEERKLQMAIDIVLGLTWLNGQNVQIVHRDLKPDNIFVDHQDRCFVADFGMARLIEKNEIKIGLEDIGNQVYRAPERLTYDTEYNSKSDVYSFGLMVWEIWTQTRVGDWYTKTKGCQTIEDLETEVVKNKLHPDVTYGRLNDQKYTKLQEILLGCFMYNPEERKSFAQISNMLCQYRINNNIEIASAQQFWSRHFLYLDSVSCKEFIFTLVQDQNPLSIEMLNEDPEIIYEKFTKIIKLIIPEMVNAETMSQVCFGRLIQWFCPSDAYFGDFLFNLFTIIKAPWFFGRVETKDAQRLPTSKGMFLIRLNDGKTQPLVSKFPFSVTYVKDGFVVNTRIQFLNGRYQLTNDADIKGKTLNELVMGLQLHRPDFALCCKGSIFCTKVADRGYINK